MFSLCTLVCNASEANRYLRMEHKTIEKYYNGIESEMEKGLWFGGESLGLDGKVIGEEFSQILDGKNIEGEVLYKVPQKHRVGFDLTFSPDKSVSLLWARMEEFDRRQIEKAYENSVKETLTYIKKEVLKDCVRRGKGGLEREKPEELTFALFQHGASRAKDPQLHVHAILVNTAKRQDGTYGAIQEKALFQRQAEIKKHFDAALAFNFKKDFGIEMEIRADGVRVPGISEELILEYSKRSQQIKEQAELMDVGSAKARSIIALDSRKEKTGTEAEYLPIWQREFEEKGFTLEQGLKILKQGQGKKIEIEISEKLKIEKLERVFETFGKQKLSMNESEIRKKVFEEFRGEEIKQVEKIAEEIINHPNLIQVDERKYTTQVVFNQEYKIEETAANLSIRQNHTCNEALTQEILQKWVVEKGMSLEQANATERMITSGDIALLYGAAGTGKSFSLAAVREIAEAQGYKIRGLTPTGKAAESLAEGSGIRSSTIDKYFYDFEKGKEQFSQNEIIVIDEAGMIGSDKTAILLKHVEEQGAKIILVGDDKQLRPIESGTPFAKLKEQLGCAEILTIRRQKVDWQKEAAEDIRVGRVNEALTAYEENGLTRHFTTWQYTKEKLVEEYLKEREIGKTQIILAPTNELREELNLEIRRRRFENREIFKKSEVRINTSSKEGEEKIKEFAKGERIYFLQNRAELGVKNGTLGTIENIQRTQRGVFEFNVKTDDGKIVTFSSDKYRSIDHGYAATVHKSQGATVDKAYVVMTKGMAREDTYVAMTRHKEEAKIYCATELIYQAKKEMKLEDATPAQKKLHMDVLTRGISRSKLEIEGLKKVEKEEEIKIPIPTIEIPKEIIKQEIELEEKDIKLEIEGKEPKLSISKELERKIEIPTAEIKITEEKISLKPISESISNTGVEISKDKVKIEETNKIQVETREISIEIPSGEISQEMKISEKEKISPREEPKQKIEIQPKVTLSEIIPEQKHKKEIKQEELLITETIKQKLEPSKNLEIKDIEKTNKLKIEIPVPAQGKEETKIYVSPEVKEISLKLANTPREMLPEILYKIATSTHGVKIGIGAYPSGKIEDYQKKALEMLKERKYEEKDIVALKNLIDIKPLGVKAILTNKNRAEQYDRKFVQEALRERETAKKFEVESNSLYITPEQKILLEKLSITQEEKKQVEILREICISKIPASPEFKIKKNDMQIEALIQLKGEHKQNKQEWAKETLENFKIGIPGLTPQPQTLKFVEKQFSLTNEKIDFKVAEALRIEQEKQLEIQRKQEMEKKIEMEKSMKISRGFGMGR